MSNQNSKINKVKGFLLITLMLVSINIFSQEKPKSIPNDGSKYDNWTINDYNNFVKNKSEECFGKTEYAIARKKSDLSLEIGLLNGKLSNKEINYKTYNKSINELQTNYDNEVIEINKNCSDQLAKNIQYRDEWVSYLKAVEEQNLVEEEIRNAKHRQEEIETNKKEELEKAEKDQRDKIEEGLRIAKYNEIGKSIEYKNWKIKYFSIINAADANILIINNLEKKYSFRNNFGNKVFDPRSFTKQDIMTYNKNLDAIEKKLKAISELQKTENNESFLKFYENSSLHNSNNGIELYSLAQYSNNHSKL